jgi:hypothetical protein
MKRIISTQQRIAGRTAIAAGSAFPVTGIVQG